MKGVAVLVVQVLVVCSAFPSRLDNLGKDVDDFVKETMKLALGPLAQVLNLPEMNSFMKMPMRMAIIKPLSVNTVTVSVYFCNFIFLHLCFYL